MTFDNRWVRPDGAVNWYTATTYPVRDPTGRPESFITFVIDTTQRTRERERASQIQRDLLPGAPPSIPGYDLAGACMPATDMSGDFYDWFVASDGLLDVTVADVMGKGLGAALMMAALRTGLRATGLGMSPAERVQLATDSMAMSTDADTLFVTLFHARIDLASGRFRYVDAGHGHWVIRRANGELERAHSTSPPLFVREGETFVETEARLEEGDALIVFSDGLIERGDQLMRLEVYAEDLAGAEDAAALVRRLQGRMPAYLDDDVTIVVLRRLAG
jgi:sigma-B regulation protein RsbU (phosphoserine phosphatase)